MQRLFNRRVVALVALLILLIVLGAVAIKWILQAPLGPPLEVSTGYDDVERAESPEAAAVTAGESICGQREPWMVLVLLTQRDGETSSRQVLALRLVKVDFENRSVASIYFPKELQLAFKTTADEELRVARLAEIFTAGMQTYDDNPVVAASVVAQALYDAFSVLPNRYLVFDLARMAAMIDAVGGVEVEIQTPYDGTAYGLPYYPAGVTHMQGESALAFAVAPSLEQRWDGLQRQTQVLKALRDALLSPDILPQAPALIDQFRQAVATDFSIQQGLDLVCLADQVTAGQVTFTGVDRDLVSTNPGGSLTPDMEGVRQLLLETFGEP